MLFYKDQVKPFLELVEEEEDRCHLDHTGSPTMRESMQDGAFWHNIAIRESFPLSDIMSHCQDIGVFQTASFSRDPSCGRTDRLDKTRAP